MVEVISAAAAKEAPAAPGVLIPAAVAEVATPVGEDRENTLLST